MDPRLVLLIYCLVLFLCPVKALKLSLVIAPSPTVVRGQQVQISCYIDEISPSITRFSLYLYCPAYTGKDSRISCFQDCRKNCHDQTCADRKTLSPFSCRRYTSSDSLTYEYKLEKVRDDHAGEYKCSFFGRSSSIVKLKVLDPALIGPPETAPPLKPPTPKPTVRKPVTRIVYVPITPRAKPTVRRPVLPTTRSLSTKTPTQKPGVRIHGGVRTPRRGGGSRKTNVQGLLDMGEKLLLVVVLLFIISLAINSVFCIRCVLIYFYGSDDWRQIKMGSLLCMNEEIRVFRDMRTSGSLTYTSLGAEYSKPPYEPPDQVVPILVPHPSQLQRQHSAPTNIRNSYQQYLNRPRPGSQISDGDSNSTTTNKSAGTRVMRVVSEIELQPGEELDETTVMYVPLPVVVQRNGSIPNHGTKAQTRRPVSVVIGSPGEDGGQLTSKPRLSTSVSGIDRLRRSSQDSGRRILSTESVFEMEPLCE